MSLINDMLKDLEARKAAEGQAFPSTDRAGLHIEELRHTDVTPPIEKDVQRRLSWLFVPFLLALLAIAVALYLARPSGPEPGPESTPPTASESSLPAPAAEQASLSAPPAPAPVAPSVGHTAVAKDAPQLLSFSATEKGRELQLTLTLSAVLDQPAQLRREGERVELRLPGVQAAVLERPHAALQDWHSEARSEGWLIGFTWPKEGEVQLSPRLEGDGLARWTLTLLRPDEAPRTATPLPSLAGPSMADVPAKPETSRPLPAPPRPTADKAEKRSTVSLTPLQQAEALYSEAWQLQQKGRTELAIEKLRQALQLVPEHGRGRELLVRLLLQGGQARAAELELLRGLDLQPRQPELVELMARLLADQGRGPEALAVLRARMTAERLSHQALLAVLAARAGDHGLAAEAYRRAAELDPRDPRWPLGRGIALENSGQPGAARAAYAQALRLEGLDAAARAFVQERLQQLGQGE